MKIEGCQIKHRAKRALYIHKEVGQFYGLSHLLLCYRVFLDVFREKYSALRPPANPPTPAHLPNPNMVALLAPDNCQLFSAIHFLASFLDIAADEEIYCVPNESNYIH